MSGPPGPSGQSPQGFGSDHGRRIPNPPARRAPTKAPDAGPRRTSLVLVLAVVIVVAMGAVMYGTQATWGQQWWTWPRGWFNTPRLVSYGTVLAGIGSYAVIGRLITRGAAYVVGLAIVVLGGSVAAFVWFLTSLITGLRL